MTIVGTANAGKNVNTPNTTKAHMETFCGAVKKSSKLRQLGVR
jgi:hypothetical protein